MPQVAPVGSWKIPYLTWGTYCTSTMISTISSITLLHQFEKRSLLHGSSIFSHQVHGGPPDSMCCHHASIRVQVRAPQHALAHDIPRVTLFSKVVRYPVQFMVTHDLSLEDVCDRAKELAFPESVVQSLRRYINFTPLGFLKPLWSKVFEIPLPRSGGGTSQGQIGRV